MISESFFFKGTFLMKFLAEELGRARDDIVSEMTEHGDEDISETVYSAHSIEPLVIHEEGIEKCLTTGYRVSDPLFLLKYLPDPECVECRVVEYRIPFEGDERLFRFTTHPLPYYPFGRLEDHTFVISVKEGEDLYISDYRYNLILLRNCIEIVERAVRCYNDDLKTMIRKLNRDR